MLLHLGILKKLSTGFGGGAIAPLAPPLATALKSKSLTIRGETLRSVGEIANVLGKEGLCDLGFDIPIEGKVMA